MKINFSDHLTRVKSATGSVDMILIIESFWIKLENHGEVDICLTNILLICIYTSVMGHNYPKNDANIRKSVMSGSFIEFPS